MQRSSGRKEHGGQGLVERSAGLEHKVKRTLAHSKLTGWGVGWGGRWLLTAILQSDFFFSKEKNTLCLLDPKTASPEPQSNILKALKGVMNVPSC